MTERTITTSHRYIFAILLAVVLYVLYTGDAVRTFNDDERHHRSIGRYLNLAEDDDRHNDGTNENESTNSPTILGYTRSPSTPPTSDPSSTPTSFPSKLPSARPSNNPSSIPSFLPSSFPSILPSSNPTSIPSSSPSMSPSEQPSNYPTSIPSLSPSSFPTTHPSTTPTFHPSQSPTSNPSGKPSTQPSYDPCRGFYGTYGDKIINSETTISYQYGVEYNTQANAPISDQIRDIESTMLELLIGGIFSECRDIQAVPASRGLLGHDSSTMKRESIDDRSLQVNGSTNEDATIIGIASSPVDLANGKKCQAGPSSPSISPDCNVIEGRLKLYLSDQSYAADATLATRQLIKTIMDDGLLDKSHPAILGVKYIADSRLEFRTPPSGNDDELQDADNIAPLGNRYVWAAAIGGVAAMTALISAGRYRFSSGQRFGEDGPISEGKDNGGSAEDFVEVNSEV